MRMQRGFTVLGLQLFWHYRLQGGQRMIPTASELRNPKIIDFPETTVFERLKISEKANMHNRSGLPQPYPLALCTLEEQEVTTKDVNRL